MIFSNSGATRLAPHIPGSVAWLITLPFAECSCGWCAPAEDEAHAMRLATSHERLHELRTRQQAARGRQQHPGEA